MNIKKPFLITGGCSFSQSEMIRPVNFQSSDGPAFDASSYDVTSSKYLQKKKLKVDSDTYADYGVWPDYLCEKLRYTPWNTGHGASGNKLIFKRVMRSVYFLLNSDIDPKMINVAVMWSQPERIDLFCNPEFKYFKECRIREKGPRELIDELTHITLQNSQPDELRKRGYLRSGGTGIFDIPPIRQYYYNLYTFEEQMINTFEYILNLQNFLKLNNIKYFFTTYQNIFNEYNKKDDPKWKGDTTPINQNWNSREKPLWSEVYPEIDYLWKSIDLDNFIFHTNEKHNFGGLGEFTVDNKYNFNEGHPSSESHSEFVNNVLLKNLDWE